MFVVPCVHPLHSWFPCLLALIPPVSLYCRVVSSVVVLPPPPVWCLIAPPLARIPQWVGVAGTHLPLCVCAAPLLGFFLRCGEKQEKKPPRLINLRVSCPQHFLSGTQKSWFIAEKNFLENTGCCTSSTEWEKKPPLGSFLPLLKTPPRGPLRGTPLS